MLILKISRRARRRVYRANLFLVQVMVAHDAMINCPRMKGNPNERS
jgi:hypothetical protein